MDGDLQAASRSGETGLVADAAVVAEAGLLYDLDPHPQDAGAGGDTELDVAAVGFDVGLCSIVSLLDCGGVVGRDSRLGVLSANDASSKSIALLRLASAEDRCRL